MGSRGFNLMDNVENYTALFCQEAAIAKVGYNAGEQKRDKEAFDKLSPCCKADDTK